MAEPDLTNEHTMTKEALVTMLKLARQKISRLQQSIIALEKSNSAQCALPKEVMDDYENQLAEKDKRMKSYYDQLVQQ